MRPRLPHVVGLTACVALLAACAGCSLWAGHPSDASLIQNFRSHRNEFDELLRMFLADEGLGRVAYDFTRPQNHEEVGVSRERLNAYREWFDELGLSAGVEGYGEKETVMFHASTRGLGVTGSSKGYAYLRERPALAVENLDAYRSPDGKSFTAFGHVEGGWYLYLDYED